MSTSDERQEGPSRALAAAALAGLLGLACATASSCTASTATDPDTPIPDTACPTGVSPHPEVTSSVVGAVTLPAFTSLCDAKKGILETQPHCGGSNACRGFSYDSETETLIQHTCRATNSCAGYSCVVCD